MSGDVDSARTERLVQRARDGDASALDALFERAHAPLQALVRARLGERLRRFEESGDVVQSALGAALRDLPRFEYRGEGSFLRWLQAIVENKLRHRSRDQAREKRDPERVVSLDATAQPPIVAPDPTPSAVAQAHDLEQRYTAALAELPPRDREILLLHLEVGCSHGELAAALGVVSPEAVRKRIARALATLHRRIVPDGS